MQNHSVPQPQPCRAYGWRVPTWCAPCLSEARGSLPRCTYQPHTVASYGTRVSNGTRFRTIASLHHRPPPLLLRPGSGQHAFLQAQGLLPDQACDRHRDRLPFGAARCSSASASASTSASTSASASASASASPSASASFSAPVHRCAARHPLPLPAQPTPSLRLCRSHRCRRTRTLSLS